MALGTHGVKAGSVENLWKSCGKDVEKCRVIRLGLRDTYESHDGDPDESTTRHLQHQPKPPDENRIELGESLCPFELATVPSYIPSRHPFTLSLSNPGTADQSSQLAPFPCPSETFPR